MCRMQVAHINDVYQSVHLRFCIEKFDASILHKYTNIEGHFKEIQLDHDHRLYLPHSGIIGQVNKFTGDYILLFSVLES